MGKQTPGRGTTEKVEQHACAKEYTSSLQCEAHSSQAESEVRWCWSQYRWVWQAWRRTRSTKRSVRGEALGSVKLATLAVRHTTLAGLRSLFDAYKDCKGKELELRKQRRL